MDRILEFVDELERRDAALAEQLVLLNELDRNVGEIAARAERIRNLLQRLPRDREQVKLTRAAAGRDLEAAQAELAAAQQAVEQARGDDAETAARRREANARAQVGLADERRTQLAARQEELAQEEAAAEDEVRRLDARARELAAELAAAPRVAAPDPPPAGLDGLVDWVSRARAALLVARGGLETERERVVREANELAASVLGEPLHATSVDVVRKQLEERLS